MAQMGFTGVITWTTHDCDTWLMTMVIVSPLRIGLWDPLQMAYKWLISEGAPNNPYMHWDDPPSNNPYFVGCKRPDEQKPMIRKP